MRYPTANLTDRTIAHTIQAAGWCWWQAVANPTLGPITRTALMYSAGAWMWGASALIKVQR